MAAAWAATSDSTLDCREVLMTNLLKTEDETGFHPESIDEWIVDILERRGPFTLDCLNSLCPNEEARLLFAVDRLTRADKIVMGPPHGGDYLLSVRPAEEVPAMRDTACRNTSAGILSCRVM
ncbi:MAG TPA: hypothetical protein VM842_07175 [Nitrospira sp.]|jgi:hypothetical protein|nr:hypothetical protein [Nitrospira sp.]